MTQRNLTADTTDAKITKNIPQEHRKAGKYLSFCFAGSCFP